MMSLLLSLSKPPSLPMPSTSIHNDAEKDVHVGSKIAAVIFIEIISVTIVVYLNLNLGHSTANEVSLFATSLLSYLELKGAFVDGIITDFPASARASVMLLANANTLLGHMEIPIKI